MVVRPYRSGVIVVGHVNRSHSRISRRPICVCLVLTDISAKLESASLSGKSVASSVLRHKIVFGNLMFFYQIVQCGAGNF
jgi:hypothetical protein